MKYFAQPFLLLLFSSVFFLAGCNKCRNVPCLNGGACEDGACICPEGFTGTNCETEDRCYTNNVHCLNDGTCFDGMCDCPEGYRGMNCEIEVPVSISQLVGTYFGSWACDPQTDTVTLSLGNTANQLLFFENDYGFTYYAEFSPDLKSFTVPSQVWGLAPDEYVVDGSGTLVQGMLNYSINYQFLSDTGINFSCSFSGEK